MEMEHVLLEDFGVEIDPVEVKRFLGSRDEGEGVPSARLEEVLSESISLARDLVRPRGIYTVTAGKLLPGSKMFEDLERVAFCICTIGSRLEEEVTAMSARGELLRAVVLDSVGSVSAEAVAEHIDRVIQDEASQEGLKTSCRASPGYGDWDIREQSSIFDLLPAERIGVRLTDRYMMIPRKSVSFAIHIAEKPVRTRSENSCRNCDIKDCPYRLLE